MNKYALAIALLLFSVGGTASGAMPQVEVVAKTAKVKVDQQTIAVIEKGQKFRALKTQGAWIAIVVGEGEAAKRGWVLASAVKVLADPAVTEDSNAPAEPVDVRFAVDLTQFSPNWGTNSGMYFKVLMANESAEPIDFKPAEIELKVDDQPVPAMQIANFHGYPVYTDASMRGQVQASALSFLKDMTLPPGATVEGWMGFSTAGLQQIMFNPTAIGAKTWIIEGKIGPHPIHIDLKAQEIALIVEPRPSKLDPSVKVIEIGPRINPLNAPKLVELLGSIPVDDQGCVMVLKNKECLFDGLATQHFQQQMYQLFGQRQKPVVSFEGPQPQNHGYGYQGFFQYGQMPIVMSENAGVLTILGARPNTGAKLIKHLTDESPELRTAAAQALATHLSEENVVKSLAVAAADTQPTVRASVITALANNGGNPPPAEMRKNGSVDTVAVVKAMSDSEQPVRFAAARTAMAFQCDDIRKALVPLLDDPDDAVKIAAMNSAGPIQARGAIPKLKDLRTQKNAGVMTNAIDALVKLGEMTTLDGALAKLDGGSLQDSDFQALGQAQDKRAVEPLIALLKVENNYQINLIARTLGEINDKRAVDPLIQAFVFGNRNYGMEEVPRALGKLGDSRAVEPLRQSLRVPNQHYQPDLRAAIFEGLLQLKAPKAMDDVDQEIKRLQKEGRIFEISSIVQALGRSRDAKAIPIIEPHLGNQQTCLAAANALIQLGTKSAYAALENGLTANNNMQFVPFIIVNTPWPRTTAAVACVKRLAESKDQNIRNAAAQALNNLQVNNSQTSRGAAAPSPIGYLAPALETELSGDDWINSKGSVVAETRGKVVAILIPDTSGGTADLPVSGHKLIERFEKQGLAVLGLWKLAGWDWDATNKSMVVKPDATPEDEQRAVAQLVKARQIKYRVGLVSPNSGLIEKYGGPGGNRIAFVDRSGVVQAVGELSDAAIDSGGYDNLITELLSERSPSPSAARVPRQISPPPDVPKVPRSVVLAYAASSFDPEGESWTIPAHHDTVWSVRFSPDAKIVATTSGDGTARLWDLTTGKLSHTLIGHEGLVRHCVFTEDGSHLWTSSFDRTIRMWNAKQGTQDKVLNDDAANYFLSLVGDDLISASQDIRFRRWNVSDGQIAGYFAGHNATAWTIAATPLIDGKSTIVSGSVDRTVRVWGFPSDECRQTLSGHTQDVNSVAITADGKLVASGADEVILWNTATGKETQRIAGPGSSFVYDLAYSPDQKTLAVARSNHTVTLYQVETGKVIRQWYRGGWCLSFSNDGKWLASGSDDRTIRGWKIAN